jgi:hypothetical protein
MSSREITVRKDLAHGDWLIANGLGRVVRIPETAIRRRLGTAGFAVITSMQVELIAEALLVAPHKHAGRIDHVEELEDWQRHHPPNGFTPPIGPYSDTDDNDGDIE